MPTLISADRWDFAQKPVDAGSSPNHGVVAITTEGIIEGLRAIDARPEMKKLDDMIMASDQYARGRCESNKQC